MLDQVFRSQLIDGDVLGLRRFEKSSKHDILGTKVQLLSGDRLKNPFVLDRPDKDIREGVELDGSGRPVAYHITNRKRAD